MLPNYVYLIMALVLGLLVWIFKYWFCKLSDRIDKSDEVNMAQALSIAALNGKIWSEEKLERTIDKSVKSAMNAWMIESVKEGMVSFGRDK